MIYQLKEQQPSFNPDTCFIANTADLIGDVQLADGVSIWFQTVIRADNDTVAIGKKTNIQDASVIHVDKGHPVTIGDNVTVGHKVMLHGCSIGDNSLIGMGAIVLNGAQIGNNCIVGAGSLVTENKSFPDNSLIMGTPAKAVKMLTEEQIELLKQSAEHYFDKIAEYQSLKEVK